MTVGGDVALAGAADSGRIDWPVRQAMMISASLFFKVNDVFAIG
jgi:hypothetical protein